MSIPSASTPVDRRGFLKSSAAIAAINATSLAQVTALYSSRPQDSIVVSAQHGGKITCYKDLNAMLAGQSTGPTR